MCVLPFDGINIHSACPYLWKHFLQFLLDTLGPKILLGKMMISTCLTGGQRRIYRSALMANQFVTDLMKIEGDVTLFAVRYPTADLTNLVR